MIHFHQVSKSFAGKRAVDNLTLQIAKGEFTVLIGTSGSGKSTTLKMINRLIEHDEGEIHFADEEIRKYKPEDLRRRMGYAIQSIGLFPHWTVERNIATVPQLLKWPQDRIRQRVIELLELLHLDPEQFIHRYPHQLSGGQQQRVGVARALAADPEVLLMDEPFGALDPVTRSALQFEITRIHQLSGRTIVLVTHDIDEALSLADRIVLMDEGRVIQQGTPLEMLTQPANDFVRDFFGRSDLGIKLLSLGWAEQRVRRGETLTGLPILGTTSLREALSLFVSRQTDKLPVTDEHGQPLGVLYFADLVADKGGRVKFGAAKASDIKNATAKRESFQLLSWLKDPLCWAVLLLAGLVFGMTSLHGFFAALFPDLDRPIYLQDTFWSLVVAHVMLVVVSSIIAVVIGVSAGIAVTRPAGKEFRSVVETVVAMGQTFPPVAVLAIAVPVMGFSEKPAIIALVLYGLLPILQGTITGIESVSRGIREVAQGVGMSTQQILWRVELPLAAPVIVAGIRTSVIINIGTAAIASTVGTKTLGSPIIIGLSGFNTAYVIQGAVVVALLAIITDMVFSRLSRRLSRWRELQTLPVEKHG